MRNYFLLILVSVLYCSCDKVSTLDANIVTLKPDPGSSKDYFLEELTDSIKVVALDSVLMGNIDVIKCYGRLFVFLDRNNGIVHFFDTNGRHINTLRKRGRGNGEYLDIETFSIPPSNEFVFIYSRGNNKFLRYSLPELQYEGSIDMSHYYTAMEFICEDKLLLSREYSPGKGGIEIFNLPNKNGADIPLTPSYLSQELCTDQMFTKHGDRHLLMCYPSASNPVYNVTADSISIVYRIDFGQYSTQKKIWKENENSNIDLSEELSEGEFAIMPQYFIDNGTTLSFWYFATKHKSPLRMRLYLSDYAGKNVQNVATLKMHGYNGEIFPTGMTSGFYLSLLDQSLLDNNVPDLGDVVNISKNNSTLGETLLLIYRFKNK